MNILPFHYQLHSVYKSPRQRTPEGLNKFEGGSRRALAAVLQEENTVLDLYLVAGGRRSPESPCKKLCGACGVLGMDEAIFGSVSMKC